MTINLKKDENQAAVVVAVAGRLDTTTAPSLDKVLNAELEESLAVVLDLKELEYISSAGLRVLLNAQKRRAKNGSMKLTGVREEVMDVLVMTGFADILVIE